MHTYFIFLWENDEEKAIIGSWAEMMIASLREVFDAIFNLINLTEFDEWKVYSAVSGAGWCVRSPLSPGHISTFLKLLSPIRKKRLKILKNMFYKSVLE